MQQSCGLVCSTIIILLHISLMRLVRHVLTHLNYKCLLSCCSDNERNCWLTLYLRAHSWAWWPFLDFRFVLRWHRNYTRTLGSASTRWLKTLQTFKEVNPALFCFLSADQSSAQNEFISRQLTSVLHPLCPHYDADCWVLTAKSNPRPDRHCLTPSDSPNLTAYGKQGQMCRRVRVFCKQ